VDQYDGAVASFPGRQITALGLSQQLGQERLYIGFSDGGWSYFTRADGLPSDQFTSVAVDADGTVYAATQCDGLVIASARDNFKSWRHVAGNEQPILAPTGSGLASNVINDVKVPTLIVQEGGYHIDSLEANARSFFGGFASAR